MSDAEKIVFKSTITKVIAYTIGVISMCSTGVWMVSEIKSALSLNAYKIEQAISKEAAHEESDNRLHAEIWRNLKDQQNQILDIYKHNKLYESNN